MDFVAYLISKNIDPQKFEASEKETFCKWADEFVQIHPKSFTAQKLFVINEIRRKFQLHLGAKPKEKPAKATESLVTNTPKPEEKAPTNTQEAPIPKAKPIFKKPTQNAGFDSENKSVTPIDVITNNVTTDILSSKIPSPKTTVKPIFKRPNPTVVSPNEEAKAETPKPEQEEPQITPENTIKKAAVKPIFKRPEIAQSDTIPNVVSNAEEKTKVEEKVEPTKKTIAKPIFKRPEIAQETISTPLESKPETKTEDNTGLAKKPMAKPIFKRPETTPETTPTPIESKPEPETKTEEKTAPAKKPMAKPIFKRPEQSSDSESQS